MSWTIQKCDALLSNGDVAAHGAIISDHALFCRNMCLTSTGNMFQVYHLKADHVPTTLSSRDATITAADVPEQTCFDWFYHAMDLGFAHAISEVFPLKNLELDFDLESQLSSFGVSLTTAGTPPSVTLLCGSSTPSQ